MLLILARNISPLVDGKPAAVSDYDVSVAINNRTIWRSTVKGHRRDDGWRALLRLISNAPGDQVMTAEELKVKVESMVLAEEPCPDCGSNQHRSCGTGQRQGVRPTKPIAPGETVCEHGLRPYECWACRSCHPVD